MLTFNNPLGFWALLAIPAILGIHFLQRKSVILPIATLFLLDQMQRESVSGQRIERLRPSIPLWLQLLMALLLTWLLVQPRWLEKSQVQRVVVVLDGSISMSAFQKKLEKELPQELGRLGSLVTTTEYILMESLLEEENLYHGTSLADLTKALQHWKPTGGSHDLAPALRIGRSLADKDGLLIVATDQAQENLPFGAKVFSVGSPLENVGFAGMMLEERDGQLLWKATLKNYGATAQKRNWWTSIGGKPNAPQSVTLAPGQAEALQGLIPPTVNSILVTTDADEFTVDDSLTILRPQPKKLAVVLPKAETVTRAEAKLYEQLFNSLSDVTLTVDPNTANVQVVAYDPLNPALPAKPAIVFIRDSRPASALSIMQGEILPEPHPFVDGLNWQSLLCLDAMRIPFKTTDDSLLWQGERSLIFLRGEGLSRQLCFNFDLRHANAHKLPAFVVLVHRFFEAIRLQLPLHEVRNCESGQRLQLAPTMGEKAEPIVITWDGGKRTLPARQASLIKAPATTGEFRVHQGALELMHGACHFADTREADFSQASPQNDLISAKAKLVERFAKEDSHWQLAVIFTLLAALISWWFVHQSKRPTGELAPSRA